MSGLEYDWYHPRIRFISVPTTSLVIQGPFEREMRCLAAKVSASSGKALPDDKSSILLPVHELQILNIAQKFPDVKILDSDISIKGYAQSSIRYVIPNALCVSPTLITTQNRHYSRAPWSSSQNGRRC
jgi:hypothetical protein